MGEGGAGAAALAHPGAGFFAEGPGVGVGPGGVPVVDAGVAGEQDDHVAVVSGVVVGMRFGGSVHSLHASAAGFDFGPDELAGELLELVEGAPRYPEPPHHYESGIGDRRQRQLLGRAAEVGRPEGAADLHVARFEEGRVGRQRERATGLRALFLPRAEIFAVCPAVGVGPGCEEMIVVDVGRDQDRHVARPIHCGIGVRLLGEVEAEYPLAAGLGDGPDLLAREPREFAEGSLFQPEPVHDHEHFGLRSRRRCRG